MDFYDYALEEANTRVEITHIDEGFSGDYNPDDPEDKRLLRFHVQHKVNGLWEDMENASYCTLIPIDIPREQVEKMAAFIMQRVQGHDNVKQICEELSWMSVKELNDKITVIDKDLKDSEIERIYYDIRESFTLAMKGEGISDEKIRNICITVDDAATNNLF